MSNSGKYRPPPMRQSDNRNTTPTPVPSNIVDYHQKPPSPSPKAKIPCSPNLISRWYATSTKSIALVPYDVKAIKEKHDFQPVRLTITNQSGLVREAETAVLRGIFEKVARDLIESSQHMKKEIENEDVKLSVMAPVGKVLYVWITPFLLNSIKSTSASKEGELNIKLNRRTFYTNVPEEYIKKVEERLTEECGFKSEREKEHYHIKVLDNDQPDLIISCKCIASRDSGLKLCKVEHNPLLIHMVTDVSCVSKNMDLQIMLNTKRTVRNLDADVKRGINLLISAAFIQPMADGGLCWSLGKDSAAAGRFKISGVRHTVKRTLSRGNIGVFLTQANCVDRDSTGEQVNEVSFKLRGLSELLTEDKMHEGSIVGMIQEVISLIWDNLLSQGST